MSSSLHRSIIDNYEKRLMIKREKDIYTMKLKIIYQAILKLKLEEKKEKENDEILKLLEDTQNNMNHLRKNFDHNLSQMREMLKITYHQIKYENSNIQKENKTHKNELELLHYQINKSEKNFEEMKSILLKIQEEISHPKENITYKESENSEEDIKEEIEKNNMTHQESCIDEEFEQILNSKNIWLASKYGQLLAVKYWIDKDPELINKCDDDEFSALHFAAQNGHNEIVKYLIENGANCNAVNREKNTPLHLAAASGYLYIIKYLIENGANFNIKNKTNNSPKRIAYLKGYPHIVSYLKSLKGTK